MADEGEGCSRVGAADSTCKGGDGRRDCAACAGPALARACRR